MRHLQGTAAVRVTVVLGLLSICVVAAVDAFLIEVRVRENIAGVSDIAVDRSDSRFHRDDYCHELEHHAAIDFEHRED